MATKLTNKFFLGLLLVISLAVLWWLWPQTAELPSDTPQTAQYHLRLGHNISANSALHLAAQRFAEQVGQASGGQIEVAIFPEQQLGTDSQMVEMAREGELDMLLTPTAKLSVLVPAMQYVDLPFFFPDRQSLYRILDGEPGRLLLGKLGAIGLVGATFWGNGFKHFTANRFIHSPDDWRNTKVRVMKSPLLKAQFNSLGATPIFTDFQQLYQALQDGVVEAQENPLVAIAGLKLYEVQSHLTLSEHAYLGYVFSFSEKALARLPDSLQTLLLQTAKDLTSFEREQTQQREADLLHSLKAQGMQVHELSGAERQAFVKALRYLPDWFELEIGADILSKTYEYCLSCGLRPDSPEAAILIGLDADLSSSSAQSGVAIKRGITMAIEEINQQGGVLGKPLALVARNHQAMPSIGINNIRDFNAIKNLVAVISGVHSPVALAELDVIHELNMPFLVPWAAGTGITENQHQPNYVFRVSINDRWVAPFLVDYAMKKNYKHLALWLENSTWGRGNEDTLRKALTHHQLSAVNVIWLNRGQSEMEYHAQLRHFIQAGADSIVLVANPLEGAHAINALAKTDKPLPVISHWGITSGEFWAATQDNLEKVALVFPQTLSFTHPTSAKQHAFVQTYMARYNVADSGGIVSPVGTAHAYDLVHLLALAMQQAGSTERAAIRDALERIPRYEGLIKTYSAPFSATEHDALTQDDYFMARYNEQGWIVPTE